MRRISTVSLPFFILFSGSISYEEGLILDAIPWAEVYVDGSFKSHTPLHISLPAGSHQISLQHPKFKEMTKTLSIQANQDLRMIGDMVRNEWVKIPSEGRAGFPPLILLDSPVSGEKVSDEKTLVKGKAKDASGVTKIEVFLHGDEPVGRKFTISSKEKIAPKEKPFNLYVNFQKEENQITVTAYDSDGLSSKKTIRVKRE